MSQTLAVAGTVLNVVGTVGSLAASSKVSKSLEDRNRGYEQLRAAEEKRQNIQRRRERLSLINAARRQRASVVSGAVSRVGTTGLSGSGVIGAQGIISNRLGGALGTQTALTATGADITSATKRIADATTKIGNIQNQAGLFAGIGSLGGSAVKISSSPAIARLGKTIFG